VQRLVIAGLLLTAGCAAVAAPFDVVNSLRLAGCGAEVAAARVTRVARLDEVARRIARGDGLATALEGAGYRAASSTFMRLGGVRSDASVEAMLRGHHCERISQPAYREGGMAQRGDDIWIVLAAPFAPPARKDAARIGARVLELVNAARGEARRCGDSALPAVAPLAAASLLDVASLTYAQELARLDRFDHVGLDGSTAAMRVGRTGYAWRLVGENLAAGPTTAEEVVAGWLASPGHCRNLMDERFTQMGIGFAVEQASESGVYWVQTFAAPR
jgi:uncharacterized protein YkwD